MKRIFTLLTAITLGSAAFGQVFQSDLSTWATGDPTGWNGTKTNATYSEVTVGATYGSGMASLLNTSSSHKRFTTQTLAVTAGETYEINIYCIGTQGSIRTSYYDLDNLAWGSYNPYVDLTTASAGVLTTVTQTITIPAGCTSTEFILSVKETADIAGIGMLIDSVAISVANVSYTAKTIAEIQTTTTGDSPEVGNFIETSGVVTGVKTAGYWIQDGNGAWSGVYVNDAVNTPSMGDSVTVQGQVDEFFDLTQIKSIVNYTLNSTPTVIPTATTLSTADVKSMEDYEGVLVKVIDVECTIDSAPFGLWTVNTDVALASDSLLIDDEMYNYGAQVLGTHYTITGISQYSYGERKLLPRIAIDVAEFLSVEENVINANIFPNPANDNITISGVNGTVSIYAINGSVVYNGTITNSLNINTQNLTTGLYILSLHSVNLSN